MSPQTEFYPPRATCLDKSWWKMVFYMRRYRDMMNFPEIHLPPLGRMVLLFMIFIPGLPLIFGERRSFGCLLLGVYLTLVLLFLSLLGLPGNSLLFGGILFLHAMSIMTLLKSIIQTVTVGMRIFQVLGVMVGLTIFYQNILGFVDRNFFVPLEVNGKTIIVYRVGKSEGIQRGQWVVFAHGTGRKLGYVGNTLYVQKGLFSGRVIGKAGDRIEFGSGNYWVNGKIHVSLPYMPEEGTVFVSQSQYFIWPDTRYYQHGYVTETVEKLRAANLRIAHVDKGALIGKPFNRWFGRMQIQ